MNSQWLQKVIRALCRDYREYQSLLTQLLSLSEQPRKADLTNLLREERRLSLKILKQEKTLRRWLDDLPSAVAALNVPLDELSRLREECMNLSAEGRSSLKSGLSLLDREIRTRKTALPPRSLKKEAAPRLIDLEL